MKIMRRQRNYKPKLWSLRSRVDPLDAKLLMADMAPDNNLSALIQLLTFMALVACIQWLAFYEDFYFTRSSI